ncbi:putative protein S-acyltransferase [Helianthus annuus]|nr:putative protein S-acyltransferase [Helianthus annuus]
MILIPSQSPEDQYVASITEEHEVTCWGCGLILILSPYTPIFKCGWCGAVTNHNSVKGDNSYFWWRRLRDRCFVCILLLFMFFIIGGGIWAIYPIVFSRSYFCGVLHITISVMLSIATLCTYILSAFRSPGAPPLIPWGSYPAVGKGGLEGYTFCNYCSKPKSSNSHHCRSCGMCVLDMDHHCPFVSLHTLHLLCTQLYRCIHTHIYTCMQCMRKDQIQNNLNLGSVGNRVKRTLIDLIPAALELSHLILFKYI